MCRTRRGLRSDLSRGSVVRTGSRLTGLLWRFSFFSAASETLVRVAYRTRSDPHVTAQNEGKKGISKVKLEEWGHRWLGARASWRSRSRRRCTFESSTIFKGPQSTLTGRLIRVSGGSLQHDIRRSFEEIQRPRRPTCSSRTRSVACCRLATGPEAGRG